jgi:hypothetical protein
MRGMGRPATAEIKLKDGFYIEVCHKGVKKGVKIWSQSLATMKEAARNYSMGRDVIVLGEYKNGRPLGEPSNY